MNDFNSGQFPFPTLASRVKEWCPTGSSYICNPPVTDTDRDYAVLVEAVDAFGALLEEEGWSVSYDGSDYDTETNGEIYFITARKGVDNLIVFDLWSGFWAFSQATAVARHLNLTNKADRVMLFQTVCGHRCGSAF